MASFECNKMDTSKVMLVGCEIAEISLNVFIDRINGRLALYPSAENEIGPHFSTTSAAFFYLFFSVLQQGVMCDFSRFVSCSQLDQSLQLSQENPPSFIVTFFFFIREGPWAPCYEILEATLRVHSNLFCFEDVSFIVLLLEDYRIKQAITWV